MRRCLVCNRGEDDPLHADEPEPSPYARYQHHPFDPGERRHVIRREDDRIAAIERAVREVTDA